MNAIGQQDFLINQTLINKDGKHFCHFEKIYYHPKMFQNHSKVMALISFFFFGTNSIDSVSALFQVEKPYQEDRSFFLVVCRNYFTERKISRVSLQSCICYAENYIWPKPCFHFLTRHQISWTLFQRVEYVISDIFFLLQISIGIVFLLYFVYILIPSHLINFQ